MHVIVENRWIVQFNWAILGGIQLKMTNQGKYTQLMEMGVLVILGVTFGEYAEMSGKIIDNKWGLPLYYYRKLKMQNKGIARKSMEMTS